MFGRRKRKPTLTDVTITAIDNVREEVADLQEERSHALTTLNAVQEWLGEVNRELTEHRILCDTLIGQLGSIKIGIESQIDANGKTLEGIDAVLDLRTTPEAK